MPPRSLPGSTPPDVEIQFEGRALPAVAGEPVAVALLRAGEQILSRSVKYHRPRGLSCFAESCASCLLRIDGLPNQFACAIPCAQGTVVSRQNAYPDASRDALRAIDWAFPKTFNHHEMFAGVPVASDVMARVARKLSGLGELPAAAGEPFAAAAEVRVATCLVGLGRSGHPRLAHLAAREGCLAIDSSPAQGPATATPRWTSARVLGLYLERGRPVLAVRRDRAFARVVPDRIELCVGSRAQLPPFAGSDLPGVLTAEAALRLIAVHRLLPSPRVLVAGDGEVAKELVAVLRAAGAEVRVLAADEHLTAAAGTSRVRGATIEGTSGKLTWRGGLIAVAGPRAPAFELAAQAGAALTFVPGRGFAIRIDRTGQTSVPWLSAFGSCASIDETREAD